MYTKRTDSDGHHWRSSSSSSSSSSLWSVETLDRIAATGAGDQKTLVVTSVNCGYVDFADNWAASLVKQGINNFVIVPLDDRAQAALARVYPNNTVPVLTGISPDSIQSETAEFNTDGFEKLTSTRPRLILAFVKLGYTTMYSDVDTVWRKNALAEVERMGSPAVLFWESKPKWLSSYMMYLAPTENNTFMLQKWHEEASSGRHQHDQAALNAILGYDTDPGQKPGYSKDEYIRLENESFPYKLANAVRFPPGVTYFKASSAGATKDESKGVVPGKLSARTSNIMSNIVVVIHNNWITGKQNKMERFVEHGLWNPSGKLGNYTCAD